MRQEIFQNQLVFLPKALMSARAYELLSDGRARQDFERARVILEEELEKTPTDPRLHASLGVAYAGLGRNEDAINEGKRAVTLYPVSRDAVNGPYYILNLAVVYAMTGEYEATLDQIDYLLSIPVDFSVAMLELDPRWDPLRDSPRYQEILEKYGE